jgi:hypothetical protein
MSWLVSFIHRTIYTFCIHCTGRCVGPRVDLDAVKKRKILNLPRIEPQLSCIVEEAPLLWTPRFCFRTTCVRCCQWHLLASYDNKFVAMLQLPCHFFRMPHKMLCYASLMSLKVKFYFSWHFYVKWTPGHIFPDIYYACQKIKQFCNWIYLEHI